MEPDDETAPRIEKIRARIEELAARYIETYLAGDEEGIVRIRQQIDALHGQHFEGEGPPLPKK